MVAAGDLDGDGLTDLWLGATATVVDSESCGALFLLSGGTSEGDMEGAVSAAIFGDSPEGQTGFRIVDAEDVDLDGYADLYVGTPFDLDDGDYVGSAALFFGPHAGERSLSDADLEWMGMDSNDQAGYSIGAGADLDGDGVPDAAIAAIRRECCDDQRGEVDILLQDGTWGERSLGSADIRVQGEQEYDHLGRNLALSGDLSGDGVADLVVSSTASDAGGSGAGAVYLLTEVPDRGTYDIADIAQSILGEIGEALGDDLMVVGDLDADGYEDLAVGAASDSTLASAAGAVYLFAGPLDDATSSTDARTKLLGYIEDGIATSIGGGDDIDADGVLDLVIGAPNDGVNDDPGRAYLLLGPAAEGSVSLEDADAMMLGVEEAGSLGRSVSLIGDATGDGYADVVIGAPSSGADSEGAVWLLPGRALE